MCTDNNESMACCKGSYLSKSDPELFGFIHDEYCRQVNNLELIASENYVSPAVLEALGSVLTNKYAEGYPGHRYYGGCEFIDRAEELAIERAKRIFGADHANVQPHAGSQANMAAYFSMIEPDTTILAMNLSHGGHLTHGSKVNFSGRMYNVVPYGVREDDCIIDYDDVAAKAREHRPALIVAGASAYPRIIDFVRFREIADSVGARLMVDAAHFAGLVAGGAHPSPVPYSDVVTMTTHKTLRGPRGGMILAREELAKAVDKQIFPGMQGGPLMHVIAAKAVAFGEVLRPEFKDYSKRIVENCRTLADRLKSNGYKLVSEGTDTHLLLIDFIGTDITGKMAEDALGEAGITVNKNSIPFDTRKPTVTSGIRIGTPAVTTRGMGATEMKTIADLIHKSLSNIGDSAALGRIREETRTLTGAFPMFAW